MYALLIYRDESASERRTPAEIAAGMAAHAPYIEMLKRTRRYRGSEALGPVATARTLRRANGKPVVTLGPFAETREQLGGLYLLDTDDTATAIELAAQNPALRTVASGIEIRAVAASIAGTATGESRFLLVCHGPVEPRPSRELVAAASLAPAATTLRIQGGELVERDGAIGSVTGFAIVAAADLDAALALAPSDGDPIEVRAIRTGAPR